MIRERCEAAGAAVNLAGTCTRFLRHSVEAEKTSFHEKISFQRSESRTGLPTVFLVELLAKPILYKVSQVHNKKLAN